LNAELLRGGKSQDVKIALPTNWRMNSDISRRTGTWGMRAMVLGGLFIEDLPDDKRTERNLPKDSMAFFVKHAGEYGIHAAAKNAGFRKDDVIVALDGNDRRISESELIGILMEKHVPGDKVKGTVLRGNERVDLMLPIQ
jgi:hypothetical protein